MTTEDLAPGGVQPEPTATTAAPEPEKVDDLVEGAKAPEATTEEGKQPDPVKDTAKEDAAASEAAKALQKRKQTMQERLNEVTRKYRDEERRANRLAAQIAQQEGKLKPPNADDYTDPAKHTADQISYTLDQRRVQELKAEHAEASQEANRSRASAWFERVQDFKVDNADFEQVAHSAPIGEETSLMVADMEEGPAVAYHLGKNPALARKIEGLPERMRPFELGKIAAQITATPPRRITTAPTPVSAISGKSAGGSDDPGDMSMEEYARRRKSGWRG